MFGSYQKPSITVKVEGRKPTLKAPSPPLAQSKMHSGGHKPKPIGNRPPPPPPQGKSGWQEKIQKFMNNKQRAGLNTVIDSITDVFEENEKLKQQLRDYRKEDEIAKLEEEINQMRLNSIHIMTTKEKVKASTFAKEHYASCKGSTRYILTGTGIGTHTLIECKNCKVQEDITDYEGW